MSTDRNHAPPEGGGSRREDRLRSRARRRGLGVRKSRAGLSIDNHGGYRIIDLAANMIIVGERFDLDLDAVEDYLSEDEA